MPLRIVIGNCTRAEFGQILCIGKKTPALNRLQGKKEKKVPVLLREIRIEGLTYNVFEPLLFLFFKLMFGITIIHKQILCRVLLAIIFIVSGFNKVTGFDNSVAYILSKGLPMPELGAAAAAALELVGAAALIVGWRTHWAALGLAIYCVLTAYFFHGFWAVPDAQVAGQTIQFLKNIAMTGGFFGIMAWGAGPWSLDAQQTVQAQTKEIE